MRSRHVSITPHYELTLIDTPGQEIFYRMRNSGSEVSDGSLLLIAVNDDVRRPGCSAPSSSHYSLSLVRLAV